MLILKAMPSHLIEAEHLGDCLFIAAQPVMLGPKTKFRLVFNGITGRFSVDGRAIRQGVSLIKLFGPATRLAITHDGASFGLMAKKAQNKNGTVALIIDDSPRIFAFRRISALEVA